MPVHTLAYRHRPLHGASAAASGANRQPRQQDAAGHGSRPAPRSRAATIVQTWPVASCLRGRAVELTDRSTALRYAQALCHADDPIVTLQAFGDRKQRDLAAIRAGTIGQVWPWVCDRQRAGCGIFCTVQQTRHGFRKAADVERIRAQFVEFDGNQTAPSAWHLQPSILVRSRNGLHAYWLTSDAPLDGYRDRQQRLAAMYGSDPVVHDLDRKSTRLNSSHRT